MPLRLLAASACLVTLLSGCAVVTAGVAVTSAAITVGSAAVSTAATVGSAAVKGTVAAGGMIADAVSSDEEDVTGESPAKPQGEPPVGTTPAADTR